MTNEHPASYPWPQKPELMKALKAYIHKRITGNEGLFASEVEEILYTPFKNNPKPAKVQEIEILQTDMQDFNMDTPEFMICLSKIFKTLPNVELLVNHHIRVPVEGEPIFKLFISLLN